MRATFCCLVLLLGCQSNSGDAKPFPVDVLGNLRYIGTESGPVQLREGVWQGEPYVPDGDSRPEVDLAAVDPILGDLDGDGLDDAAVVLTEQLGGSGIFVYVAIVSRKSGEPENVATVLLGDRVGVTEVAIEDATLRADLVVAGEDDPLCCPTQRLRIRWKLEDGELHELLREDRGRIETDS